jgi:hypothetical protein
MANAKNILPLKKCICNLHKLRIACEPVLVVAATQDTSKYVSALSNKAKYCFHQQIRLDYAELVTSLLLFPPYNLQNHLIT